MLLLVILGILSVVLGQNNVTSCSLENLDCGRIDGTQPGDVCVYRKVTYIRSTRGSAYKKALANDTDLVKNVENYKCYSKAVADALVLTSKKTDKKTGVRSTYVIKEFYLQEAWDPTLLEPSQYSKESCYGCLNSTRRDKVGDSFVCMDSFSSTKGICCHHIDIPVSLDPKDRPQPVVEKKSSSRSKKKVVPVELTPEQEAEIVKKRLSDYCERAHLTKYATCGNYMDMSKSEYFKYGSCPVEQQKCYQKRLNNVHNSASEILVSTIAYREKDVCSWSIKPSESELYFVRLINITVVTTIGVDCKILYGPSLDQMNKVIDCSNKNGTSYYSSFISADQHVRIISIAHSNSSFIQVQYAMDDLFDGQIFWLGLGTAITTLACAVGCFIQFVLKKTTQSKLAKANMRLKDYALNITIEMSKAKAANDEKRKRDGKPPEKDPYKKDGGKSDGKKKSETSTASKANEQTQLLNNNNANNTVARQPDPYQEEILEQRAEDQNARMQAQMMNQMNNFMMQRMMKDMMDEFKQDREERRQQPSRGRTNRRGNTRRSQQYEDDEEDFDDDIEDDPPPKKKKSRKNGSQMTGASQVKIEALDEDDL